MTDRRHNNAIIADFTSGRQGLRNYFELQIGFAIIAVCQYKLTNKEQTIITHEVGNNLNGLSTCV